MAVELGSTFTSYGASQPLVGRDAERLVEEVNNPSRDERRIDHLRRSDEAFEKLYTHEPANTILEAQ
jgi:hypothetical protein